MQRADLVVVPTRPSPHDLRAVGPTVDIADSLSKSLVFVVNSATPRARITSETAVALSQHGVVAPVTLHHRVDFAASMIDGRTVGDIQSDSKSAVEVSALWMYLRGRLAKLYGGADVWAEKARVDFSTVVLTPESALQSQLAGPPLAAPDDEDGEWDVDLPAWASMAVANATANRRRATAQPRTNGQVVPRPGTQGAAVVEAPAPPERNTLERRIADRGPPPGLLDRRQTRNFGRRPTH